MHRSEEARRQEVLLRRLSGLGLTVKAFPDGRGVVVTLPLGPERFELPRGGSARFDAVSFATVGGDRIKCMRPLPFFYLPLIRVGGCAEAREFEARIRAAWRARLLDLLRVRNWLEKLGLPVEPAADDAPVLGFPLGDGVRDVRAQLIEPGRVILPGVGPLSGIRLRRAEDRVFATDPSLPSGVDVEIAVSTRLEELARADARMERERAPAAGIAPLERKRLPASPRPAPRILLVGPALSCDDALLESFRKRGYEARGVRSEREAMRFLEGASADLVLAESQLGRFEGVELIPELRTAPGVEEIPVVIVDSAPRPEQREAARRAGAAGYLVRPLQVDRIEGGIASLVQRPKRRRFRRFQRRLAAHAASASRAEVVAEIGRGGMLVWTERPVDLHSVDRWEVALPEVAGTLGVQAEVIHLRTLPGSAKRGLGLRFRSFDDGGEALLIRWMRDLERGPATRSEAAG